MKPCCRSIVRVIFWLLFWQTAPEYEPPSIIRLIHVSDSNITGLRPGGEKSPVQHVGAGIFCLIMSFDYISMVLSLAFTSKVAGGSVLELRFMQSSTRMRINGEQFFIPKLDTAEMISIHGGRGGTPRYLRASLNYPKFQLQNLGNLFEAIREGL